MTPRLRMEGVRKAFGATRALDGVSLEVAPGEAHALVGENGAGKSTLMKVLSGAIRPDAGAIFLDGRPFAPRDPLHARRCGVAMIYQELNLAPHLSVAENTLLGREPALAGWIDTRRRREMARDALAHLGHAYLPLDTPAGSLPVAQQQIVEIARAMIGKPRVVIMDEPTSSLTRADAENLFRVIRRLREGGASVVYISHFLEECQRACSRFTVLRDGATVGTGETASAPVAEIIRLMVGRSVVEIYPRAAPRPGETLLEVRGLAGRPLPERASFALREGEILGIAGLVGAGRTEMLRALFGLDPASAGEVRLFGRDHRRASPARNWAAGVGMLSEDRKNEGLMLGRSVADNLTLTRFAKVARAGIVSAARQRAAAAECLRRLEIKARDAGQPAGELSGGNQQKVALARLLYHDARVLLLDEPTRGIDVGSKAHIYRAMADLAAAGRSIVCVSSYLPELLGVCHRIAVMSRGRLGPARPVEEWTEHSIMEAAIAGGAPE